MQLPRQQRVDKRCRVRYNPRICKWQVLQGITIQWTGSRLDCIMFCNNHGLEIQNPMELETYVRLDNMDGVC